jgi:hypothetical protein
MKTMTRSFAFAATAIAALAAAPAFANDQLIASAGLTAEQAEGLTLNQIVAAKYNRDRSFSDRQAVVLTPSGDTAEVIAAYNAGKSFSDRQPLPGDSGVTASSRSMVDVADHAQLIASAGLTPAEAEGLTLNQIVAAKDNRDRSFSDRQRVGDRF